MATDLIRSGKNNQKRGVSVAVVPVSAAAGVTATGDYNYANLPAGAITSVAYYGTTNDTTAATVTATLKVGGTAISSGVNMGSTTPTVTAGNSESVRTTECVSSGGVLSVTIATAAPTEAVGYFVVEYVEVDKANGELTNI